MIDLTHIQDSYPSAPAYLTLLTNHAPNTPDLLNQIIHFCRVLVIVPIIKNKKGQSGV